MERGSRPPPLSSSILMSVWMSILHLRVPLPRVKKSLAIHPTVCLVSRSSVFLASTLSLPTSCQETRASKQDGWLHGFDQGELHEDGQTTK